MFYHPHADNATTLAPLYFPLFHMLPKGKYSKLRTREHKITVVRLSSKTLHQLQP